MPLIFNLRHLETKDLELTGELTAEELELTGVDDLVRISGPVAYQLLAEQMSDNVLVRGVLQCTFACQCVRCLRDFTQVVEVNDWACDLPLEGEDKVPVTNDFVDLTPYLREDILLAFPQHPLCEPDCPGLLKPEQKLNEAAGHNPATDSSSAWAALNKLKL
jgi:uncharacterized protein